MEKQDKFRAAEIADQYGGNLSWARRLTEDEKEEYAEWFKDLCMIGIGDHIRVHTDAIRRVVGDRKPDGMFSGCSNQAWTINKDEWELIIKIDEEVKTASEQKQKEIQAAEKAEIEHKIKTGFCFSCESWCHGDCGNYSSDPDVQAKRTFNQIQREANYGL